MSSETSVTIHQSTQLQFAGWLKFSSKLLWKIQYLATKMCALIHKHVQKVWNKFLQRCSAYSFLRAVAVPSLSASQGHTVFLKTTNMFLITDRCVEMLTSSTLACLYDSVSFFTSNLATQIFILKNFADLLLKLLHIKLKYTP